MQRIDSEALHKGVSPQSYTFEVYKKYGKITEKNGKMTKLITKKPSNRDIFPENTK